MTAILSQDCNTRSIYTISRDNSNTSTAVFGLVRPRFLRMASRNRGCKPPPPPSPLQILGSFLWPASSVPNEASTVPNETSSVPWKPKLSHFALAISKATKYKQGWTIISGWETAKLFSEKWPSRIKSQGPRPQNNLKGPIWGCICDVSSVGPSLFSDQSFPSICFSTFNSPPSLPPFRCVRRPREECRIFWRSSLGNRLPWARVKAGACGHFPSTSTERGLSLKKRHPRARPLKTVDRKWRRWWEAPA